MQEKLFKEKYPIHTITIKKDEAKFDNIDAIIETIQNSVKAHPVATYIGIFDHYTHTSQLSDGEIAPQMSDAKNIIFCFGKELLNPMVLAVRPRSIGVADMGESFVLSFLEAPNPAANQAMIQWCKSVAS
ncbi:MAG: hypothetical protein U9R50_06785 [Campylobacterota bacterium]|nr:hypothetical protein [Campylobacterota bacterium]